MAYGEKVLDHYENPRNVGKFEEDDTIGTGMVGAPACFTGDTLISTPENINGAISLKEMYDNNTVTYVWSFNIKNHKYELKLAKAVMTGNKPIVKLSIDDGATIRGTPDHEFLKFNETYDQCKNLKDISLKSFSRTISNNGYWQINRQAYEHVYFGKILNNIDVDTTIMWEYNIDHIDENKLNNSSTNLQMLTIADHLSKSTKHRTSSNISERVTLLAEQISKDELYNLTVIDQLPRWQIGDKLKLTVDWVKELQRYYGLTAQPKRMLPEEQRMLASERKLREGNPNFSGVSDIELLQIGNQLYTEHGKLTSILWKQNARDSEQNIPTKVEHRFGKFSTFAEQAINFNHKITSIEEDGTADVYCLQVEENNNFVILTSITQNRHSGFVVKNCGDVMRLQIKVNDEGIIEDAVFKTYGCGSAIASSSLLTEMVKGKTLDEAREIKNTHLAEELALPPVKIHCSVLAEDAINAAVDDYMQKHNG